jgi:FixJ family two-component response regulator
LAALKERFGSLSPRQREITIEVARGQLNKQIAGDIGVAEASAKVHRNRLMRLSASRMADKLKLIPEEQQYS